jgi:DNA processing protein
VIAVALTDSRYPGMLRDLRCPPDPLWIEGDAGAIAGPAVAIVGTRRMSAYGERIARELAAAAARAGQVVVSGLAQGIDSVAHAAAVDAGGRTIAVLGEGLEAFSPYGRRRRLAQRIAVHGCLVSEYPPLTTAKGWMFARRNTTIAALAAALVVVEAPHGSGALITAHAARRLGREVYAVPGPLGAAGCAGTNALIASGTAALLLGPQTLGLAPEGEVSGDGARDSADDQIVERLAAGPLSPDALGAEPQRLARLLLAGRVVVLPDGRFARR